MYVCTIVYLVRSQVEKEEKNQPPVLHVFVVVVVVVVAAPLECGSSWIACCFLLFCRVLVAVQATVVA